MSERKTFGTAAADSPVTRADFERALRSVHLSNLDTRDLLLRLAAHVVELTEELARQHPEAKANIAAAIPQRLVETRAADKAGFGRVWLETDPDDKYTTESPDIPCEELIPLCGARCCSFEFSLTTQDLDEGVIRWDYGRPYMIRQRASDKFCVHNDPTSRGCTVHSRRPRVCRAYDCRDDKRVWIDYEKRIAAPLGTMLPREPNEIDIVERVRRRELAIMNESLSVQNAFPDQAPHEGPPPPDRKLG